jgi:hypothetical protein
MIEEPTVRPASPKSAQGVRPSQAKAPGAPGRGDATRSRERRRQDQLHRRLLAARAGALLEFANQDLTGLTDEGAKWWGDRLLQWIDLGAKVSSWRRITDSPFAAPGAPGAAVILATQEDLRTWIRRLLENGRATTPHLSAEVDLVRDANGRIRQQVMSGSALATFFAMTAEVLANIGPALRRCERAPCPNFAAALGHTRYCSAACARRAITKRYNAKHRAEIQARKRAAREGKRARALGDAVPSQRRVGRDRSKRGGADEP